MMARIGALALAALLSASIAGCEKTGEKEQNAEGVANRQAEQAQNEAARKAANAQAEADQKVAAARASFEQTREDYRHSRQSDLDKLDKSINDLEIKERTATGNKKAKLDSSLPGIRAQRDAFVNDFDNLGSVTPASWDDTRARLDREWDALKSAVSKAQ